VTKLTKLNRKRVDQAMRDAGATESGRWVVEQALRLCDEIFARVPFGVAGACDLAACVLKGQAVEEENRRRISDRWNDLAIRELDRATMAPRKGR
jgi:hypothetical protein